MNDFATSQQLKLFISHAHGDQLTATRLTEYLVAALPLRAEDIRCSSVLNHLLPMGKQLIKQLRKDLLGSTHVIALLSHFGTNSSWVKYELGAAWATNKRILPILGPSIMSDNPQLGPVGRLKSLSITEEGCAAKLTQNLRQIATELGMQVIDSPEVDAKQNAFIETYLNWGGIHADFSHAQAVIAEPTVGSNVGQVIGVQLELSGQVPENAYIWVAITNRASGQIWPKEMLNDLRRYGRHTINILENGKPEPGDLGVCLLGVGVAGNARIQAWVDYTNKVGSWSGLDKKTVPGLLELACVSELTLVRHQRKPEN